ncbi:MAG: ABC transporter substrate-binding protein [Candidatus Aminicenantes bacterium]|nr:ABC transporter substrate-binding protein [Candidatus Aminicenantes bacterium]
MRRLVLISPAFFLLLVALLPGCRAPEERLYTFGIFQITDAPTLNEARRGFIQALKDGGLGDGVDIRLMERTAGGDTTEAQQIAHQYVEEKTDMIVALSTQCLQAAIIAAPKVPVVFTSVANPYLLGVGRSAENHVRNITGVASTGPIKQILGFIREALPGAKRIGTLWTPAELNSEYYLRLLQEGAAELGFEVISQPVANSNEVLLSGQMLLNRKIDAIFPISDNTINAAFETLGRLAQENGVPLFGGFPLFARLGACAAMGWDFYEMGYRTGEIALRIKNGEDPGRIPIQTMSRVRLHLNLQAAERQGVIFSPQIRERADDVIKADGSRDPAEAGR